MKKKSITIFIALLVIFPGIFLTRCAKQSSPTGGPQDKVPPVFLLAEPANRSVFFNSTRAIITFDEFIQLKDPSKEIFISPPMRTKPEYKVQGKKIVIQFTEDLKKNTTYTINFGNSLADFAEGNPLVNFEYVFSTGAHIDSLSIPGKVLNAFNHNPEKEIIVMVYQDDNDTIPLDSLPFLVSPKSASKTTKEGNFRINNLAEGKYLLFALEDLNNNYIFDLPNERIAFLDSLITLSPPPEIIVSTVDSLLPDPAISPDTVLEVNSASFYTLYLFQELDTIQRLLSKKLLGPNLLQYIFRLPADSVRLLPVNFEPDTDHWYLREFGTLKDTINFWLKPGLPDTIRVCITERDSIADTTRFILSKPFVEKAGKRKTATLSDFKLRPNISAGAVDYYKNLEIYFSAPIVSYDSSRLTLNTPNDTLTPVFIFTDSLQRKGEIKYPWEPGATYSIIINDSSFRDLGGKYNDSTGFRFRFRLKEDYGLLLINVIYSDSIDSPLIIQLISDKDLLLREKISDKPGIIRFEYLMPGNYKLKAIRDKNANGKWDTGNYGKSLLPEKVEYYPIPLVIRANWDLQEDWRLE